MKTFKIVLLTMFLALSASAQRPHSPKMIAEMNDKKWAFIVQKAGLSEQEAKLVRPIFDAHENGMLALYTQGRESRAKNENKVLTEKDYAALNDYAIDMERKKLQLLEETHAKLSKILSPRKLFIYNRVNRDFRRKLFDQQKQRHQPSDRGQK